MTNHIRLACALVAIVALAGCLGAITGEQYGSGPIEQVPEEATMVVHAETALSDDETTIELVETLSGSDSVGADIDAREAEFEAETGLDPAAASELLAFYIAPDTDALFGSREAGFIVYADWDESTVIESIEENTAADYRAVEYEGGTLYRPADTDRAEEVPFVGVLADGQYVFGDKAAVTASLDVEHGGADSLSGDVRAGYEDVDEGDVRFAATVPAEGTISINLSDAPDAGNVSDEDDLPGDFPDEDLPDDGLPATDEILDELPEDLSEFDTSAFEGVDVVAGSYTTTDETISAETRLYVDSEAGATDVAAVTDGAIALIRGTLPEDRQRLAETLRSIAVEQDGRTVSVTFEDDRESVVDAIEDARGDRLAE